MHFDRDLARVTACRKIILVVLWSTWQPSPNHAPLQPKYYSGGPLARVAILPQATLPCKKLVCAKMHCGKNHAQILQSKQHECNRNIRKMHERVHGNLPPEHLVVRYSLGIARCFEVSWPPKTNSMAKKHSKQMVVT